MKIVLDTNVLISGIFWSGTPSKIRDLWINDEIHIYTTREIVDEYLRVIDEVSDSEEVSSAWKKIVLDHVEIIEVRQRLKFSRDPDDDKFINCAIAAKALYLVSGDRDLLVLQGKAPVEIVTPAEFYRKWTGS